MSCDKATLQMSRTVKTRLDGFVKLRGLKLKYCADQAISEWLDKQEAHETVSVIELKK